MEKTVLRVALYVRVSTEEQAVSGYSLQAQEEALVDYAQQHSLRIVGIYRDEGHSARKPAMQRPELQRLLQDVQAGKLDRVLFIKLDRWFRNVKEYHRVQAVLDASGVTWQAILEDYDTATADGRLKVNIMLSVAENESDRTSERIRFVFDAKRRRKEWCFTGGRDHWPYGYMPQADADGVLRCVKDPQTAPILQDFWDYVVNYNSVRKAGLFVCEKYGIQRHYRTWTVTSRQEIYTGTYKGVEGYCEPYISRADWERIILGHQIIKKTQKPDRIYLFTGLLRCPCCGATLKGTFRTYPKDRSKEFLSYRCNNAKLRTCDYHHSPSEITVEKWLLAQVREQLQAYTLSLDVQAAKTRQAARVQDVVTLTEQLRRLNVIYMTGTMPDSEYRAQAERLQQEITQARAATQEAKAPDPALVRQILSDDFPAIYASLSKEDRRRLWRSLISRIDFPADSCRPSSITWLF